MAGEKILIVDDNSDAVTILTAILKKGGYAVSVARDGVEALHMATEKRPALILLDLMLPKMDGFEVCRRIRDDPALRDTIIFFLSAKGDISSKTQAITLRVREYIIKPFTPQEILEKVQYHLSTPKSPDIFSLAFLVGLYSRLVQLGLWIRLRSLQKRPAINRFPF
ncbi:MAG: response regulator [Candidatus Manganitrophus sp.]|nr:response regulator [Candidatus Manganitrophus sp.]MDC4223706.1 response regulator [Candidatus Manganitrophus sp.]WDT70104.1 MAG: response regulator [Candidatus Manganitrophus sp.]WDT77611.1 MAG: response regulator [Candidatus Manganitrophus sp.]